MNLESVKTITSGRTSSVCHCIRYLSSKLKEHVAIKIIQSKERAFTEINTLLMMDHPNIMNIIDVVEEDDSVGIIMPLMQMDLRGFLSRAIYPNSTTVLQINLQIMRAVHCMHTHGILHLDIKPENICIDLLPSSVLCRLLDFGSAVVVGDIAMPLVIATTRGYQSPELIAGGMISPAGDIFSVGVVFGELLDVQTGDISRQLSDEMQHAEYRLRPSSHAVLERLEVLNQ